MSETIRNYLIQRGIRASKIEVISNAVESIKFTKEEISRHRLEKRHSLSIAPCELLIGYVGRLSEEKGVNYLIEAVVQLRNEDILAKLLIIGDGPERSSLDKQVRKSGLENSVIFAGFHTDIEYWLPAFDIFALPSLTEGMPMAMLEAMAASIPVIATAVGGIPKVLCDGVNGFLIPPGMPGAISERIRLLKDDPEFRYRIGRSGFDTVTNKFGIERWCQTLERLYCSISEYQDFKSFVH